MQNIILKKNLLSLLRLLPWIYIMAGNATDWLQIISLLNWQQMYLPASHHVQICLPVTIIMSNDVVPLIICF